MMYKNKFASVGIASILIIVTLLLVLFFLPKSKKESSMQLNIYNWADYIDPQSIEDFEQKFDIQVNLFEYTDETEMIASVRNNSGKYDLIITEDDSVKMLLDLNLLDKVNKKKIGNLKNIHKLCLRPPFDLNNNYSIPYQWGTTAFAINTKYIPEDTNSWDIFWNINYKDKVALLDNPSEVIGATAKFIGVPLVPTDRFQLNEIRKFIEQQKEVIRGYEPYTKMMESLEREELWAAQMYSQAARAVREKNPNIKYIIPMEGAARWMDSFVIPKTAANKRAAEQFIDFILRPEISAGIITYLKSTNCNQAAWKLVSQDLIKENERISDEKTFRFVEYYSKYDESEAYIQFKNDLWEKLIRNIN